MSGIVPDVSLKMLIEEYGKLKGKVEEKQTIINELK